MAPIMTARHKNNKNMSLASWAGSAHDRSMNNTLALAATLTLDGTSHRIDPCLDGVACDGVTRTGSAGRSATVGARRHQVTGILRAAALFLRYRPSLSERTLDQAGVAEWLRRR